MKYFDDMLDALMTLNSAYNEDNATKLIEITNGFLKEAAKLHDEGAPPESEQGQDFAKRFWKWMMEITGGDITMMQKMNEQSEQSVVCGLISFYLLNYGDFVELLGFRPMEEITLTMIRPAPKPMSNQFFQA